MSQCRRRPGLREQYLRSHGAFRANHLECHAAIERQVPSPVDRAERPASEHRFDSVVSEDAVGFQFPIEVQGRLSWLPLARTESAHLQAFKDAKDFLGAPAYAEAVHHLV